MKKLIFALAALLCFVGCEYDDTEIKNSIEQIEKRLSAVETVQNAYKNNLFIKSVVQTTNGYTITFSDGSTATITNGKDGADGKDGKDGVDGAPGKDGIDGKDGDTLIESITISESEVTFVLTDGRRFSIPLYNALSVTFDVDDTVVVAPNSTLTVGYSVESNIKDIVVEVTSSADIKARVVEEGDLTGKIEIKIGETIDEYSKVVVFVSNGEKVIMRSITFEQEGLQIVDNATKNASAEGGEVVLEYLTNVDCEVVIPEDAKSWISIVPATRAMEKQTITLKLESNEGYYRSATVTVQSSDGTLKLEYQVEQEGELGAQIDPTQIPDNEIWYTTIDNSVLWLSNTSGKVGNATAISNEYNAGKGIIKLDTSLTRLTQYMLGTVSVNKLKSIYLPSSVNTVEHNALGSALNLEEVVINSTELTINGNPVIACPNLAKFSGPLASEDGRCLVVDGTLYSFAPCGLSEYTIPEGVVSINGAAFESHKLKILNIPEGVKFLASRACAGPAHRENKEKTTLEYVYLPKSLEEMDPYAFLHNNNIKAFYGDCCFISDDNLALIAANGAYFMTYASGADVSEYTIPEGVVLIENYAFYCATNLKKINFPDTFIDKGPEAFSNGTNIETITGKYVLDDNRSMVIDGTLVMLAGAGLEKYTTPKGVTKLGYGVLGYNSTIKEYVISDEVVEVLSYGYLFSGAENLEIVTISANMKYLGYDPFVNVRWGTPKIKMVYCRATIPPIVYFNYFEVEPQRFQFEDLTIFVPNESLDAYMSSSYWAPYRNYIQPYEYTDLPYDEYYISSDYSQDGAVTMLQKATEGNGVDIVLMGDGYSDRQIADGTYERVMKLAYEKLFTEEPYKSYKELFNVYYVTAVSATEGYEHGNTAFGGWFGEGTAVGGSDDVAMNYALNAVEESRLNNTAIVVMMNSDRYTGTCYMYYPDGTNDYGSGVSVSYFPVGTDEAQLEQLLHHETCGHGFTKLADEYAYDYMGAVPADQVAATQSQRAWGWWKNVDFTSDTTQVLWAKFISDERYKYDGLGAYEGGMTYWSGVWRPTENSIMNTNVGGFNAPSREAIYYRIHKLAYGNSWTYDYEKFVEYDEINRKTSAMQTAKHSMVLRPSEMTAPPVVVRKTWRDVLKR